MNEYTIWINPAIEDRDPRVRSTVAALYKLQGRFLRRVAHNQYHVWVPTGVSREALQRLPHVLRVEAGA